MLQNWLRNKIYEQGESFVQMEAMAGECKIPTAESLNGS